jgi:hypothetical protein
MNMTIWRIAVQTISSVIEPWISPGRSASERRRYLIAKYAITRKMSVEKNAVTPSRKK